VNEDIYKLNNIKNTHKYSHFLTGPLFHDHKRLA